MRDVSLCLQDAAGLKNGPDPVKIFLGINTGAGCAGTGIDGDTVTVPHGAQLLERLGDLDRGLGQQRKLPKKANAIGVDANVTQRSRLRQAMKALRKSVTPSRDRGAAEIQGLVGRVQHHLDHIWVGKVGYVVNGMRGSSHAGIGVGGQ